MESDACQSGVPQERPECKKLIDPPFGCARQRRASSGGASRRPSAAAARGGQGQDKPHSRKAQNR